MKRLINYWLLLVCISLSVTCQKSVPINDGLTGTNLKKAQPISVTVPFKAEGYTTFTERIVDLDLCGPKPIWKITVDGPCNGTHLGKCIFHSVFCCNVKTGEFWGGEDVFIAADGDSLFFTDVFSTGIVPPDENDPPYYKNKWDGINEFIGGTGRFEGATGRVNYHAYNSNLPEHAGMSFHSWEGTITVVRGNR